MDGVFKLKERFDAVRDQLKHVQNTLHHVIRLGNRF